MTKNIDHDFNKDKTNILYLYPKLSPNYNYENITSFGGAQRRLCQLAMYFKKQGFNMIIASDDSDKALIVKEIKQSKINHIRTSFASIRPLSIINSLYQLFLIIRSHKINIIHSHHRRTTLLAVLLSKICNIPVIHNARVTFNDKKLFRYFTGNHIIAVSKGVKRNLIDYFGVTPNKIIVIYNGISVKQPTPEQIAETMSKMKLSTEHRIVSVIGRISKQKGHTYLIDALPAIIQKFPSLRVLFIGGDSSEGSIIKSTLEQQARDLNVHDKIKFAGHQEDINSFIGISEFTILPSLSEGLPGVVIESLLLEKAVIATDVGGTSEIINNMVNGILVEPKNPDMLADAITYMLSHPEITRKMGRESKKSIEKNFSISKMFSNYSDYYSSLLNS